MQKCLFSVDGAESSIEQFGKLCYQLTRFIPARDRDGISVWVFVDYTNIELNFLSTKGGITSIITATEYVKRLGWDMSSQTLHCKKSGIRLNHSWQGTALAPLVIRAFKRGCPYATDIQGGDGENIDAAFVKFRINI